MYICSKTRSNYGLNQQDVCHLPVRYISRKLGNGDATNVREVEDHIEEAEIYLWHFVSHIMHSVAQ